MIKTKADLKEYISADCRANVGTDKVNVFKYIAGLFYKQENILVYRYLKNLRKREYYLNSKSSISKIIQLYY